MHNIHKVVRNLEMTVKNAHVRVEEPAREVSMPLDETEAETYTATAERLSTNTSTPAVAFGICLRGISLGLDERADEAAGGGSGEERWFGDKFRAMETALLGNFCEISVVKDRLREPRWSALSVAATTGSVGGPQALTFVAWRQSVWGKRFY